LAIIQSTEITLDKLQIYNVLIENTSM
jgi:hypothetical protein